MVHRINKVIPDIDNRLQPADSARTSANLRFAASIGQTDLGCTLVNGMAQILYPDEHPLPEGDNQVVGTKEDFETQAVFFALWNSNNNHGIYRILNGTIALVIGGAILDFQEDSDVSIAVIDGKIYWTDDHSQPKMVNIEKGIAGLYPDPLEEWMITQIKRPPGLPLTVERYNGSSFVSVDVWSKTQASNDYSVSGISIFNNDIPFEFAYYYVYDNDEESAISPYSIECYYTTDIRLTIPAGERFPYADDNKHLVKRIVYLYRQGNDGVWYVAASGPEGFYTVTIDDLLLMPKITVAADITDRLYDAVPIKAVSNEVAQNRINLGNYLSDYDTVSTLTLTATAVAAPYDSNVNAQVINKVHKPGATYNVGVELLDEWGRRIGVVNQVPVTIPTYENFAEVAQGTDVPSDQYQDWQNNSYWIDWQLTGTVPSWVKYFRIVESQAVRVVDFHRFTSIMLYWYLGDDGVDYLSRFYMGPIYRQDDATGSFNTALDFYHKGYGLFLPTGSPINFTKGDETFIVLIGNYGYTLESPPSSVPFDYANYGGGREYKVDKQVDNVLYFQLQADIIDEPAFPDSVNYGLASQLNQFPSYFQVEVTTKTKSPSELYYQNENVFEVTGAISETGSLYGDCYLTRYKKTFNPFFTSYIDGFSSPPSTAHIDYVTDPNSSFPFRGGETNGVAIAMNPTSIYDQNWNPQQGQVSIVNETQKQVRVLQGISFSSPLIVGTQINGLNKFNSVDNRQAPLENGPITALVRTNATQREPGVLLAIGKNGVQSFYYDGVQLTNVDGSANVSTTTQYLASQRPLVGNYGAERLRDICVTPLGTVYYWSEGIQDLIRYTNAGLQQLGETYEFMNYLRNQLESSTRFMITYDQVTDEVILVGNNSQAYIFSERYKTFQGARDYYDADGVRPERGANLSTRTFFFKQGQVWQMGPQLSAQPNSFFGDIKNPQLTIITNEAPTVVKRWGRVRVFGPKPLTLDLTSEAPEGGNDDTLVSYIRPGWWMDRKWNFDAAIRTSVTDDGEVLNGKPMESRLLISTFAWDANTFVKLNYIQVDSNIALVQ